MLQCVHWTKASLDLLLINKLLPSGKTFIALCRFIIKHLGKNKAIFGRTERIKGSLRTDTILYSI